MPTIKYVLPKYRKHKVSGQAVVSINGKDHYLGTYGSPSSKGEYERLIGEWLANGRRADMPPESLSLAEMIGA